MQTLTSLGVIGYAVGGGGAQALVAVADPVAAPPPVRTGPAGDFPAGSGLPVLHTSRAPDQGCHWVPYVDYENHLALLVEACNGEGALRETDTADLIASYRSKKNASILVFDKPAGQTLEAAVHQQVVLPLKPAARLACKTTPARHEMVPAGSKWRWYDLSATAGPLKAKYKTAEPGDDLPCDPWEQVDSAVSFVYSPAVSNTHFLFLSLGQDTPPWDVESIVFLP